ncbi:proline--tRNA ligase [bacterium]|nr:proline--tRNA ligase [bacterium]
MRQSKGFFPTLREVPKEAEAISHILMLRAGLVRQLAAGLYIYLPLGWRSLRKIEQIMREEMDAAGAIEVLMPTLQPDELWKKTGRYEAMGPEMMRLFDRGEREFVLGPTHEEVITNLVANEIRSYRDLPINLYQIQTKFRDEVRPRFGIVRAREFIMKDGYSFDMDEEGAGKSYQLMYDAYFRAFTRCGLTIMPVEADTGVMGGSKSHEFMVPAKIGEAEIASCDKCEYKANRELTESAQPEIPSPPAETAPLEEVHTPEMKTVEDVAAYLGLSTSQMIKTMVFVCNEKPYIVLLRGDHTVNEVKLAKALGGMPEMADPATIEKVTHAPVGFAGPQGIEGVEILADHYVKTVFSGASGANKKDYHVKNIVLDRDYKVNRWGDFRAVDAGDPCPKCGGTLSISWGIEVGHVFILGTKYSDALNAVYTDESGQRKSMIMGCYGIGVSRTLAAVLEENADDNGIVWPVSVAPYHIHVLNLDPRNAEVNRVAEEYYATFQSQGYDVLMDEREERPGIKFKDADLLGIPYRIVVGAKSLKDNKVEFVLRKTLEKTLVEPSACYDLIHEHYKKDMEALQPPA